MKYRGIHFCLKQRQCKAAWKCKWYVRVSWVCVLFWQNRLCGWENNTKWWRKKSQCILYSICAWSWQECTVLRYWIKRVGKPPSVFSPPDFQESRILYITVNIENYPKFPWFNHRIVHEVEYHICSAGSWWPLGLFVQGSNAFLQPVYSL